MGPGDLEEIIKDILVEESERILVGFDSGDDAGVFLLDDNIALVQTVDFFPPVVDSPRDFGRIAAANALSDIYAMGARPLTALNLVAISCSLGTSVLKEIILGAQEKIREAGAVIVGGHSIEDEEPKFGLAITGIVEPSRMLTKRGARAGDSLVLTKPLGTGILTTALKGEMVKEAEIRETIETMAELNKKAAEALQSMEVHACTDVTGFGLAGHLLEMIGDDTVDVELWAPELPVLPRARDMAEIGMVPAGKNKNAGHFQGSVSWLGDKDDFIEDLIYDPQTSGGLLISLPDNSLDDLKKRLGNDGFSRVIQIGRFVEGRGKINVLMEGRTNRGS